MGSVERCASVFGGDVVSFREGSLEAYLPRHESIYYPFQYLNKRPVWHFIDVVANLGIDWSEIPPDPSKPTLPWHAPTKRMCRYMHSRLAIC